jgi:hypothetical protein
VIPFLPGNSVRKTIGMSQRLTLGAVVPSNVLSAPSSMSRTVNHDVGALMTSSAFCPKITSTASIGSSSRTIISHGRRIGEVIFDRIIKLREQDGMDVRFLIQVDTLCHKIPNFVAKAKRAGATRIFIGLENINPDNLLAAKKRQNKITEYRNMLLALEGCRHLDLCRLHSGLSE